MPRPLGMQLTDQISKTFLTSAGVRVARTTRVVWEPQMVAGMDGPPDRDAAHFVRDGAKVLNIFKVHFRH